MDNFFSKIAVFLIRIYQVMISPYKPSVCRFTPSCSSYGLSAINKYGFLKGIRLFLKRFLKCHPFSSSNGYDPLP